MLYLSVNRMVEPSPPALHHLSCRDVSMANAGVKVEQEESGEVTPSSERPKTSPLHDWSGNQLLEARQLTPPLSCSPSVRMVKKGMIKPFCRY